MMLVNLVTTSDRLHASYRYRTEVISQQLLMQGVPTRITPTFILDATVCVFSKHWNYADFSDAIGAKTLGKRVVMDICDMHSETSHADHYRRMVSVADEITCNSEEMARRIREVYSRAAKVIPDPIIMEPLDRVPDLEKWCWIGHHANLESLADIEPMIEGHELTVCSSYGVEVTRPNTRFVAWTPEAGERVLNEHGVCLVPYGTDARRVTKSANRIIEALNKSMIVITNGIPASKDLQPFVDDFTYKYDWSERELRMVQGREYVRKHYSQAAIGKLWRRVLCD